MASLDLLTFDSNWPAALLRPAPPAGLAGLIAITAPRHIAAAGNHKQEAEINEMVVKEKQGRKERT